MNTKVSMTMLALCAATATLAQPVVDGTLDSSYGSALAVQTINTGFGVANGSGGAGSELDAAYGVIQGGTLYVMLTGDIEGNYNHVDLLFDTGTGGQNVITGGTPDTNPFTGLTLSSGFNASSFITLNGGIEEGDNHVYVDQSQYSGGVWSDAYLGEQAFTGAGTLTGGSGTGANANNGVQVGVNDSNVGVQTGTAGSAITNSAALLAVNTGIEFGIPLADLGNPTGPIKIIADVNGSGDNYFSNQFFSGLPVGTGNLGAPGSVNLTGYGNPYFVVPAPTPEPASMIGIALGAAALIRKRRKA